MTVSTPSRPGLDTPAAAATPEPTKPEITVPKGKAPKKLVVKDIKEGTGAEAKAGSNVTVQYVGTSFKNGRQFDASWDRGEPFSFQLGAGAVDRPVDWLLYSEFSVVLAFVHLYTLFVVVPVFNSLMRIDRRFIEAARDAGASGRQTLFHVILPLSKPGLAIGAIFVGTLVMGDFVTVGVMGGQQIASVGKAIQTHAAYLQFPAAAAQSVVLLAVVLLMVAALTRLVDVRREL